MKSSVPESFVSTYADPIMQHHKEYDEHAKYFFLPLQKYKDLLMTARIPMINESQ